MTIIGIDPAFRKGGIGFCTVDVTKDGKSIRFLKFDHFFQLARFLESDDAPKDNVFVVIENSNLQNITFNMAGGKDNVALNSRNVGKNQAISQETYLLCCDLYGEKRVFGVSPKEKGAKWNAAHFKKQMAANKISMPPNIRVSQDMRDAAQLAIMGFVFSKIKSSAKTKISIKAKPTVKNKNIKK